MSFNIEDLIFELSRFIEDNTERQEAVSAFEEANSLTELAFAVKGKDKDILLEILTDINNLITYYQATQSKLTNLLIKKERDR